MRLLLLEPDLFDNGALRVSLDRAAHWSRAGHDVRVLVVHRHADGPERIELPAGLDVRFATSRPRRPAVNVALALRHVLLAARWADVVVAGREIGDGLLYAAVAARTTGTPLAVTVQSRIDLALQAYVPPRQQGLTRWALRRADRSVCVAAGLVPLVEALGVPRQRISVVTNGVDVPGIRERALCEPEVPLDGDLPVVVASGRLTRQKGFDVLVRAHAAALAGGAPLHRLVVLGEGPERGSLEALVRELGVQGSVRLPGFVDNPHPVIARAALFVLPSRWEGYPLTLVEALALGVPAVAADCVSGPREVLELGRYGALVPTEDVGALSTAVASHLAHPDDLQARAAAARQAAEERHDPAAAARGHLDVLLELVARRRR